MPKTKSLLWQSYPYYLFIVIISLCVLAWQASGIVKQLYLQRSAEDLEVRSRLLSRLYSSIIDRGEIDALQELNRTLGNNLHYRITVILPSGEVIADSEELPSDMDNHADRPEIREAMQGKIGISTRYSYTLSMEMMYVAAPIVKDGDIIGVVRSSFPVIELSKTLGRMNLRIALLGFFIILGAALVIYIFTQRIKKPVHELKQIALRFGKGELDHRLYIESPEELRLISQSMNQMAAQLHEKLMTITDQRNELENILSSMLEGVILVNVDEEILRFNRAAGALFGISPKKAIGKHVQEIVRNVDLLRFIRKIIMGGLKAETEITLREEKESTLRVYGTIILNDDDKRIGALIVLNNITQLKELENVRSDFVANVSHELKTPITAIQGAVETLRDGKVTDTDDGRRFLDMIKKHTSRLDSIIEDLLSLSRIEQGTDRIQMTFKREMIGKVIESAVSTCRSLAQEKKIEIEMSGEHELFARMNAILLEEAIVNLIDNAIKYSEPGKKVRIHTERRKNKIYIEVQDWGPGISKKDQKRIFERFYRTDKARSRELGGTGLGLAIVKHIVQSHSGQIHVMSAPGTGSTFIITLPAA